MRVEIPNLDKVETGREPLPADKYTVKLTAGDIKNTKDGSGKYIAWQGAVQGGTFAGRILFWNTSLKESALWNLKGLLDAAGVPMDNTGFSTEDALGKDIIVTVDIREYEGKPSNEIKPSYSAA